MKLVRHIVDTTKLVNEWDEIKTKGPSKCVDSKLTPKGPFFLQS